MHDEELGRKAIDPMVKRGLCAYYILVGERPSPVDARPQDRTEQTPVRNPFSLADSGGDFIFVRR